MFEQVKILQRNFIFLTVIARVASVSIGFSARSRHFSLFDGAKIGASATLMEGAGSGRGGARPNFRSFKERKMLQTCGKPYGKRLLRRLSLLGLQRLTQEGIVVLHRQKLRSEERTRLSLALHNLQTTLFSSTIFVHRS